MAIFKCKMCGGTLEIQNNETVAVCEYCGTKQTVPSAMDENLQTLFNRANTLRIKSEFDKAEQIYEKILQSDETQAEAYWGLILCKFGIEYVEDPATFKRVPTCHRTSFDSIISDEDYKSALKYADAVQKNIYEQEAKEIDRIQKEIIALSSKEEPYDVFICYKETDGTGSRTQDSVIANDIYYQLTNEGFKVFYAAITLEDKLGSAYEPCIFAALNSAKVMLSIGTKPEYFNAVWVKNEWSRFLKMMKTDRSKMLIPCYKDMDAYELPEEFAHLQAQDMSKIGFINDVVRGIKKIVQVDEPKAAVKETVIAGGNANIAPLLKRAFMFLEDGDFDRADDFCEQVLNIDPECAEAYLGKLMAKTKTCVREDLSKVGNSLYSNAYFDKLIKYASDDLKSEIEGYYNAFNERIKEKKLQLLNDTKVGSYIKFGSYMQNYSDKKEEIEWLVLEIKGSKALLISKYVLDCKVLKNECDTAFTWETCALREWLNSDFINLAFSAVEQAIIPTVTVSADMNPKKRRADPGNATQDQVFLLSMVEAYSYFKSDNERLCKPTKYSIDNNANYNKKTGTCSWELRTPGWPKNAATFIYALGKADASGFNAWGKKNIRPALWIDLSNVE